MTSPYIVGPPVRKPADFFGRAQQTRQFFQTLAGAQMQSVSILGLRRAGKTSFLQHIAHPCTLAAYVSDHERYIMAYLDVSSCRRPEDFYNRLNRRLASALDANGESGQRSNAGPPTAYQTESLLYEFAGRRVVILLDEFDQLRTGGFGADFLTELRALASVWEYDLAFVTASYWDLYRLGNFVGLPPTSPFYNIFHPTPIYLSGMTPAELDRLVRVPAERRGVTAGDHDVAFVRHIAGSLPFFVQAVASAWLARRGRRSLPDELQLTRRLASEMWPYFDQWWRGFSDVERDVLQAVVLEESLSRLPYSDSEIDSAVHRLRNYGVIVMTGNNPWSDSLLFSHWLREFAGQGGPAAGSAQDDGRPPAATGEAQEGTPDGTSRRILNLVFETGRRFERQQLDVAPETEEELRDIFLRALEPSAEGDAAAATFGKTGRTGVVVRANGSEALVVECSLWRGQKALLTSIDRLLGYLTWRDAHAAVALFVRSQEFTLVVQAVRQVVPQHDNHLGFDRERAEGWLDYQLRLPGDPQRRVNLAIHLFRLSGT